MIGLFHIPKISFFLLFCVLLIVFFTKQFDYVSDTSNRLMSDFEPLTRQLDLIKIESYYIKWICVIFLGELRGGLAVDYLNVYVQCSLLDCLFPDRTKLFSVSACSNEIICLLSEMKFNIWLFIMAICLSNSIIYF